MYDWKKEGLKKQYSVLDRAAFKVKLGISSVDLQDGTRTKMLLKAALDILNDRKKELKIADTSEGRMGNGKFVPITPGRRKFRGRPQNPPC